MGGSRSSGTNRASEKDTNTYLDKGHWTEERGCGWGRSCGGWTCSEGLQGGRWTFGAGPSARTEERSTQMEEGGGDKLR